MGSLLGGNGLPMYVKASGTPVFDANGEFRGYRGTGSDVTERKRADEALRESAEALRRSEAYAEAGADAILMHSKQETPDEINF